jgi:FlaA1/EpsC-like NDP-sugar epimerase
MSTDIGSSPERQHNIYKDSTILISGGSGSIGLQLTANLLKYEPREVRLFSNDENGLFEAKTMFNNRSDVVYRLGDVRDTRAVAEVVRDSRIVFHAAASKHVIFCEENPYDAVSTNVVGTKNMIDSGVEHAVEKFVFISTDKAVNPVNVMGATKLLGEKLVLLASRFAGATSFSIVRFGNVLGSRGSVLRIFERQIHDGNRVTVTDPMMTRFVMLPREAAELVLQAAEYAMPGETFVLKMRAVRIKDLAEASREFYSKIHNKDPRKVVFETIGARPGEKMHEELMTHGEAAGSIETENFYIVNPNPQRSQPSRYPSSIMSGYTSNTAPLISKGDIASMLSEL